MFSELSSGRPLLKRAVAPKENPSYAQLKGHERGGSYLLPSYKPKATAISCALPRVTHAEEQINIVSP